MADPLSIAASVAGLATAAIQSARSLNATVKRYKERDKTLQRLQNELEDLSSVLETLEEVASLQTSVLPLLKRPVSRCSQRCRDFENCMKTFHGKSKVGFRDWTKMEFMRGSINDFMNDLAEYKSTISVGLGTITMRTSMLSHQVLEEYGEIIKDTTYSLNVHLQRIDERMELLTEDKSQDAEASIDLKDEELVTRQCIRICEDAKSHIASLGQHQALREAVVDTPNQFEAQVLTRKTLDEHRVSLVGVIARLQNRLETMSSGTGDDVERTRLREDIETSRQCLEVCNLASTEVSRQKVYTVGEAIADGGSDQVVVNTLADLFDVRKALSKNKSAQLIATTTEETLRQMSHDRYNSRFGAVVSDEPDTSSFRPQSRRSPRQDETSAREVATGHRRPNPNEMRKRTAEEEPKSTPR